jgi:plasmid stabilization system protein ParE
MKPVKFSPDARDDIRDIFRVGVATWGSDQANYFIDDLLSTVLRLEAYPDMGTPVPQIFETARYAVHSPYILLYTDEEAFTLLVRVLDARSQLWQNLLIGLMKYT